MSGEILNAKNEISMVLGGRKTIAPIYFLLHFLPLGVDTLLGPFCYILSLVPSGEHCSASSSTLSSIIN